MFTLYEMLMEN